MKIHTEVSTEILDSIVSCPSSSSKTILNQNTKDVFDKITNSLKPEVDNAISVKFGTETFLHNPICKDIENIIHPMMILDTTDNILSYRDQNFNNRILSQSNILCMKETMIPFQITSTISKNDFHGKESNVEIIDSDSDLAKEKSAIDKKISIHSDCDNSDTIINKHCIEMKPPPHERLFWKKSNESKTIIQMQKHDAWEPSLQENQSITPKIDPCIDSEYLIEKKSVTKFIPQMRTPYQEISERFDENVESIDRPVLPDLEDRLNDIKSSCGGIEKNKVFPVQYGRLEDKIGLQEDKEEPVYIVDNIDATLNSKNNIETNTNQVASIVQVDDYHCPICMKTFAHKCNIGKHMLLHAGVKPYRCIICGKTFSQKCNTQRHMKTHANDQKQKKNFEESRENISILETDKIKDSIEMRSNKELEKNNRPCNNSTSITDSILKESSTDSSKCDVYLKEFSNNEHLCSSSSKSPKYSISKIHKKPFKCGLCLAAFLDPAELSQHIKVHEENQFNHKLKESTKDMNFQSPYDEIYTDIKPSSPDLLLSCEYCGHKFLDLWELSKHEEICHFENKTYTCESCRSIILGTREYLTHLKKFHKKSTF